MPPKKTKSVADVDVYIVREKGINAKGYGHVAKAVMIDPTLDLGAKGLYAYLSSAAGSGEEAYRRRSRIFTELGIGERGYITYMQALENRGYIVRAQSRTPGGTFSVVVVEFVMIPAHLQEKISEAREAETKPTMYSGTIYALGYGLIPRLVTEDTRITVKAKGFYAYISAYAAPGGEAFPSRDKILKELNISKNSYTAYLKELTTYGYITTRQSRNHDGTMSSTTYQINMYPDRAKAEPKPCPKKGGTVKHPSDGAPCPKKGGTVEQLPETEPRPKKGGTVTQTDEPCPNLPCPVLPCPVNSGTALYNTNTILDTNTNLGIDRLIDAVREKMHYQILKEISYEQEPAALLALELMIGAIEQVFTTSNSRIQIGSEVMFTETVRDVLLGINNNVTVAVIERYLARMDDIQDPGKYLLACIYNEIVNQVPVTTQPLEL